MVETLSVVLDFVNPDGTGQGLLGGERETGLDELGLGGKALTHTFNQHTANLGGRGRDSSRCPFISAAARGLAPC